MIKHRRAIWTALTVLGLSVLATGCELIASVDRDQIPGPDASTGAGGTPGAGGTAGGSTGGGGAAGDGQDGSGGAADPDAGDATTPSPDAPADTVAPDAPKETGTDQGAPDLGVDTGAPPIDAADEPDARQDVTTDSAVAEAGPDGKETGSGVLEASVDAASSDSSGNDVLATADAGEDASADAEAGDGA